MILASVDPGLRVSGLALWRDGELVRAELVAPGWEDGHYNPWNAMGWALFRACSKDAMARHLVIEVPRTYGGRAAKGDANDLIQVALVVGSLAGHGWDDVEAVTPQEWKGQTPKEITERRARAALTAEELGRVDLPSAKSKAHNVWDAIGLGLWALGRAGRRSAASRQL